MRPTRLFPIALAAAALTASGCATTHFNGDYCSSDAHPHTAAYPTQPGPVSSPRMLAVGGEWRIFWGLLDAGKFDVDSALRNSIREDEAVANIEIKDRLSFGGFVLFIASAGILSHHNIEVKGEPIQMNEPRAPQTAPTSRDRTVPAGYPQRNHEDMTTQPGGDQR